MKRWRRSEEVEEEVAPEARTDHRPFIRRSVLGIFDYDDEEERMPEERWKRLEKKIRAGKYRPKPADPWTLHVLYEHLTALGDL